MADYINNVI